MAFRISPHAVCRELIRHLEKEHRHLDHEEEVRVLAALKNCGVPNATERVLAGSARQTLKELLGQMG